MKLLTTIYRNENINLEGKTFLREAVRGIIFHEGKLLMICSPVNGDYKFPGGGVEVGEPHHETLRREIREECGAALTQVTGELGKTISYAHSDEEGFETFKMNSYYYFREINGALGAQKLDDYEDELGFRPEWVSIETALETNKKVLAESNPAPWWTRREIFVLETLKKTLERFPNPMVFTTSKTSTSKPHREFSERESPLFVVQYEYEKGS